MIPTEIVFEQMTEGDVPVMSYLMGDNTHRSRGKAHGVYDGVRIRLAICLADEDPGVTIPHLKPHANHTAFWILFKIAKPGEDELGGPIRIRNRWPVPELETSSQVWQASLMALQKRFGELEDRYTP